MAKKAYIGVQGEYIQASDLAVGTIVKIMENGVATDYKVVNQGIPSNSALYDSSCDGTWLLRETVHSQRTWNSEDANDYETSDIRVWLEGDFYNSLGALERAEIKTVKIPYRQGSGKHSTVTSGADGLKSNVFLPSFFELGYNPYGNVPAEGSAMDYFVGCSASGSDPKRVKRYDGANSSWWSRSPYIGSYAETDSVYKTAIVIYNGDYGRGGNTQTSGVVPMFIINGTAKFDATTLTLTTSVARKARKFYFGADSNGVNLVNAEKPIASVSGNGNISAVNNQIVFNYLVAKDTYFFLKLTETLLTGQFYTVSFDCSGVDDETELTILIDNQSRNPMLLKNGRLSRTFTPHRDVVNQLLMDDASTWVNVVGKEIVLSNFRVKKYHPEGVARRIKKAYIGANSDGVNLVNTANPVSNGRVNGNYSISDKKVTINYTTTGDAYFWVNLAQPLISNTLYTLSFDCECEDDGIDVTWTVNNQIANVFVFRNGKISVTFSLENDATSQLLIDDTDDAEEVQEKWFGKNVVLSNFSIERHYPEGVARLWYERNPYFVPADASSLVTSDGKTFCLRGD